MQKKILKIGITGGIGSGKSTVCKIFEHLGIEIYNSDAAASHLMNTHTVIIDELTKKYGNNIYLPTGFLNKTMLAGIIFNNKQELNFVNQLTHPIVKEDFENRVLNTTSPYLIKEAAILFESGAYKQVDKIITVFADKELRIKRVITRTGMKRKEVISRMNKQLDENEKASRSDYVIYNNDKNMLTNQVLKLHQLFLKML